MRRLAIALALLVAPPDAAAAREWSWPVRGDVLTAYRNGPDPYSSGQHRGIDVAAPVGTPVVAAVAGTVEYAGTVGSAGLTVSQRTSDGRYQLSYLHLSRIAVHRGQSIDAGERLGDVGVSGRPSAERPHLHFGVRAAGERHGYVDPLGLLGPPPAEPPQSQPRPAPAPVPAGEPIRPEPVPAAAPAPAPLPVPAPAPAPLGRPAPALGPAPATAPAAAVGAPSHGPQAVARHAGLAAAADPDVPAPQRGRAASAAAAPGPASGPLARERDARVPGERPPPASDEPGGLDAGWLAACLGLVAAAALLAGPHGARRGQAPVRTAFGALLRAASRG